MGKEYNDIKNMFEHLRSLTPDKINESMGEEKANVQSVPYTKNDELMSSIMETTKTQFGADYTNFKNPMLYYPEDGDVTLSGMVPTLNNLKFQFRYRDSNGGCYIWSSPLTLNDSNLSTLNKIYGVFKNWKQELSTSEDIKPMSLKNTR